MKIERHDVPVSTIDKFADANDLVMEVFERGKGTSADMRYYAHFKDASVAEGGMLRSTFGNGATVEDAIAAYAMEITEALLVIGGNREGERRIRVPRLLSERAYSESQQGPSEEQ